MNKGELETNKQKTHQQISSTNREEGNNKQTVNNQQNNRNGRHLKCKQPQLNIMKRFREAARIYNKPVFLLSPAKEAHWQRHPQTRVKGWKLIY